jgi:AcrR family transcriptional regulator
VSQVRARSRSQEVGARSRPHLDRAGIVDAALRLAERPSAGALSFRKLGAALGADPTAIYRHFADRDELMRAIIDRLLAEVDAGIDPDLPWDERLRLSAMGTLRQARRYPAIGLELAQHTTSGPGERESIEIELRAWRDAGLGDDDVVRFYAVFSGYVLSAAASVAAHVIGMADANVETDSSWVGDLADVDADRYPLVSLYREPLAALEVDDTYAAGVELFIDAARALGRSVPQQRTTR